MTDKVERELLLDASLEEVWEAVTADGWLAEEVELDLRPGGDAEFRSRGVLKSGWVEEALRPERLAFWWAADGEPATRVELWLEPASEATRLRISESRPLDMLDLVAIPLPGIGGSRFGPALVAA